jgi:hypothetical protein
MESWYEALQQVPDGAIEWAFKEFFRRPPMSGWTKFPEEWEILKLLKEWKSRQPVTEQSGVSLSGDEVKLLAKHMNWDELTSAKLLSVRSEKVQEQLRLRLAEIRQSEK